MTDFWTTLIASGVFSGVISAAVTLVFQSRIAAKQRKLDCLRRVAAFRGIPVRQEWLDSVNEVFITFNGSPKVIASLRNIHRELLKSGKANDAEILDLLKAMMADLGLDRAEIDDEFLKRAFVDVNRSPPGR